ncbi:hypothetical protein DXG01_006229 [Tephrocybe rancida]|nr:hypothetical protein DXG01_006229 [Tephrocybe rancida]
MKGNKRANAALLPFFRIIRLVVFSNRFRAHFFHHFLSYARLTSMPPTHKSPGKASLRKRQKEKAVVDPSTWRASTLPRNAKIKATDITKYFRLSTLDLKSLAFEEYVVNSSTQIAHLFKVREVERRAWEKHGGPEGWDARLQTLRKRWRNTKQPFPEYKPIASPADIPMLALVKEFPQTWIWEKCNEDLDRQGIFDRYSRLEYLKAALETLPTYPERPTTSLISHAPSVTALRNILARAPATPAEMQTFWSKGDSFLDWGNS